MQKMTNKIELFGRIYEHDLKKAVTGPDSKNPGTEYITGTVSIATDDDCFNVVPVHYTFVTAATKNGKPNATFATLSNIIDGVYGTVMKTNKDDAAFARIDTQIGLNEFYTERSGETTLVSAKRAEGGFIHIQGKNEEPPKIVNKFTCDMLITNVRHVDADEEKGYPEKAIVKGAIFKDYNKTLMPVEFTAAHPDAISYFEGLDATGKNPTFTQVWGKIINETIVRTITEESAFGEASVREIKSNRRDWVLTGAKPDPYEWDNESTLTADEVNEAIKTREIYLATLKSRSDEYKASRTAAATSVKPVASKTTAVAGTFDF